MILHHRVFAYVKQSHIFLLNLMLWADFYAQNWQHQTSPIYLNKKVGTNCKQHEYWKGDSYIIQLKLVAGESYRTVIYLSYTPFIIYIFNIGINRTEPYSIPQQSPNRILEYALSIFNTLNPQWNIFVSTCFDIDEILNWTVGSGTIKTHEN